MMSINPQIHDMKPVCALCGSQVDQQRTRSEGVVVVVVGV